MFFPCGKTVCIGGNKTHAYVINRKEFDIELAEKAMAEGAIYKLRWKVKTLSNNYLIGKDKGTVLPDTDYESVSMAVLRLISDDGTLDKMSSNARKASIEYTLEKWQDLIGKRLLSAWGPLKSSQADDLPDSQMVKQEM